MHLNAVYRVISEQIIMFVKIMNRLKFFGGASYDVIGDFDGGSVRIKDAKTLFIQSTPQATQASIYLT